MFDGILEKLPFLMLYIGFGVIAYYFFIARPQKAQQDKREVMMDNVSVGDHVITIGGILAIVHEVKEDTIAVRVADKVIIEILKKAIAQRVDDRMRPMEKGTVEDEYRNIDWDDEEE